MYTRSVKNRGNRYYFVPKFLLLLAFLIPIFSNPSASYGSSNAPETTGVFLSWCNGASEDDPVSQFKEVSCLGYLGGTLDATSVMFGVNPEATFFCPPENGISTEQFLEILNQYVAKNPDALEQSTRVTVLIAYGKAFPCPVPQSQP